MAIDHRLATGRLHLISPGIYAVGRRELTPHGRWMAAVLACGDGAVLSHRSAAELWGIGREWEGRIDVTIRRRTQDHARRLKVRSRPSLPRQSLVRRHGIPVTDPVQTLIDLATELKVMRLERAVNEADVLDLVDPETLRRALDGYVGMPGVKTLRDPARPPHLPALRLGPGGPLSPLGAGGGLRPPPLPNTVLGYEVDFWFPDHGLVVETDGLRYHRTPAQQARAAKRDQIHTAAGLRVLRFTHWQIAHEPNEVTAVLRTIRPHLTAAT